MPGQKHTDEVVSKLLLREFSASSCGYHSSRYSPFSLPQVEIIRATANISAELVCENADKLSYAISAWNRKIIEEGKVEKHRFKYFTFDGKLKGM